jgi:hypothetical protein
MGIKEKITEDEKVLLEVLEDPIWFSEFMRSTNNGEVEKDAHPKKPFEMRWYQKDLLTDKNEYISLIGGRSIGKCQPGQCRVYTTQGYKTLGELNKVPSFGVFCLDEQLNITVKRAKVYPDKLAPCWTIITSSGHEFIATSHHPVLTNNGWKQMRQLKEGDYVAVATSLPPMQNPPLFKWHELRLLGYLALDARVQAHAKIPIKYKKQEAELEIIAQEYGTHFRKEENGSVWLERKNGFRKHPFNWTLYDLGAVNSYVNGLRKLPEILKTQPNDSIQIFLEALFSRYASIALSAVALPLDYELLAQDIQEVLLRFGVETRIEKKDTQYILSLLDSRAIYRFLSTFSIPGVGINTLPLPPPSYDHNEHLRFEPIVKKWQSHISTVTFATFVYDLHNYIGDNLYVHNSLVLEDKIVYEIVNNDIEFPDTPEEVLATTNKAQMTPILNRLILRFTSSPLLKHWLQNRINRSEGVMTFPVRNPPHILHSRIAGTDGQSNFVGLHVGKLRLDEVQVMTRDSYSQLSHTLNTWDQNIQVFACGVPNSIRTSLLYQLDQKSPRWKKYRIPSHNNPYYSREDDIENIKKYGGIESDDYQNLVAGRHGAAAFQVLINEDFLRESFKFFTYRYNTSDEKQRGTFKEALDRPKLPDGLTLVLSVDPGFVDPTLCNIVGFDGNVWRTYVRYRIARMDYPVQEQFIDWLDDFYNFSRMGIDIGSGGNGGSILQGLHTRAEYRSKGYEHRLVGFNNSENVAVGVDSSGREIKKDTKSFATELIVKHIQSGYWRFSEFDIEGMNQLERIARQRGINGIDRYFILSEEGRGKSKDDHIYASYIVFALTTREVETLKPKRQLGRSSGVFT